MFIPDGTIAADYWVQGVGIGTATFTATAEHALPATSSVEIRSAGDSDREPAAQHCRDGRQRVLHRFDGRCDSGRKLAR